METFFVFNSFVIISIFLKRQRRINLERKERQRLEEEKKREKEFQEQKRKEEERKLRREQKLKKLKILLNQKNKDSDGSNAFHKREISPLKRKIKTIELEILHEKASQDPSINLDDPESYDCHFSRLIRFRKSKRFGEYIFMGERGGIYSITATGYRRYR